jgi:type IV pilus assembly protein PilP
MIKKLLHRNSFSLVLINRISVLTKLFSAKRAQEKTCNSLAPINRDKCVNEVILCKIPQKTTSNLLIIAVVLLCAMLFTACSKDQPQAPSPAPSQPPKAVAEQPKPVQKQTSSVLRLNTPPVDQFDFSNKKDPFKPFVVVKAEPKNSPESTKKIQLNSLPIHSFDVSQFKLIGIITGGRENQAMVTDPDGKGYVLKVGMLIGKNNGRITSISSSGIDILEQFKDDNGRVRKENIKLTLPRK